MNKLSVGQNLVVALVTSFVLAFLAITFDQYRVEINAAPFSYRVIWYLMLGGIGYISAVSLAMGLWKWRRE